MSKTSNISSFGYLHQCYNTYQVLSDEEERALLSSYKKTNDKRIYDKLVMHNLRAVHALALKYKTYGISFDDLYQTGTLGLMVGIQKYDETQNVKLMTYATNWIKAYMLDFIKSNKGIVKALTTGSMKKVFFNLRKEQKDIGELTHTEAKDIAKKYNVSVSDVLYIEHLLSNGEASQINESFGDDLSSMGVIIASDAPTPEEEYLQDEETNVILNKLMQAINSLDERSSDIIKNRYMCEEPMKLKELAEKHNISHQRVLQIEQVALKNINDYLSIYLGGV